ncbi:MarR family winged helix-turn-helix transcriptional regulator [Saccharothrix variisporea]|uniref:DNA-binding MarR family transcriptional regulator n=1 Tax=Saccharothrix variisporea TaxID=543527 RepID=A0A495X0X5_9PSEU|nr:MarR family transcriptional regulator [Saccharothrix variisporea]RKT67791.1 DNA-binding MarR family transcriptional regulator [Saccharothrix variisporea]
MTASGKHPGGIAFLLAQLGAHAANRFAERTADLGLAPSEVGLLRMIATQPGRSQRSLAEELGVVASRVTALVDPLERSGLVERRRSTNDRRNYELHLTDRGMQVLGRVREVAMAHEAELCEGLDERQRDELATLLRAVAEHQGLTPGVHPGYRA